MRRSLLHAAIDTNEEFVEETSGTVAFVVLSHLDWDHVNGVQRLLADNIRVNPRGDFGPHIPGRFALGLMLDPVPTIQALDADVQNPLLTRDEGRSLAALVRAKPAGIVARHLSSEMAAKMETSSGTWRALLGEAPEGLRRNLGPRLSAGVGRGPTARAPGGRPLDSYCCLITIT
jgi:hypothetical protein